MKTRNQIFWATIAIINALSLIEQDEVSWLTAANTLVMVLGLGFTYRATFRDDIKKWRRAKTRREAHRLR